MAENTKIQWAEHTFNPWIGCSKVGEGCRHCYAENLMDLRYGRVKWGPATAGGTRSITKTWGDPLRWDRDAAAKGVRYKVFCASLADVFEDWSGPILIDKSVLWVDRGGRVGDAEASGFDPYEIATLDHVRANLFRLIDRCQNLDWLLLTKRPENVRRMWVGPNRGNVWLGTSMATQREADAVVPRHLANRGLGPILFLSLEPQVERIDLSRFLFPRPTVDWVITGGESKQGKEAPRDFNIEWARLLVQQCREAVVPCFVKQLGSKPYDLRQQGDRHPHTGVPCPSYHPLKLVDAHGGDWIEWPEDLRVRQCPESFYPSVSEAAKARV